MIDAQPIHDTVQVTKVIIDTVRASSKDSMELLTTVNSFYNDAWDKLLYIITGSFTIIGVIVPIAIQWYQRRELKLNEEKLKKEIKEEIEAAVTSMQDSFLEKIEQTQIEIKEYADNQLQFTSDRIEAESFYLHAIKSSGGKNDIFVVMHALDSIESFLKIGNYRHSKSLIKLIKDHLPKCSKNIVDEIYSVSGGFQKQILTLKLLDSKLENSLGAELDEIQNLYDGLSVDD